MKKSFWILALLALTTSVSVADEGMWLPSLVGKMRYEDMKAKGFKLTAKDLYDINRASLKDAIVRFGRGCTGEFISEQGLLITNHHCGFSQVQSHSSVGNDYITDGFWAKNRGEELSNEGLTVSRLVRMDDVTKQALKGTLENMPEAERKKIIDDNTAAIVAKAVKGNHYSASVEPFYYGNQYFLFVYEVFRDVRLVGAPPTAIGSFGGDTDNWMWPRHTGDFSIFRVYADKDNKPADYSPDNVPYNPKKFFTISLDGVDEGDFTFVYGFPGRTYEYLTSDAVDYMVEKGNPHKINLRTIRLNIITDEQSKDVATRIKYASKKASVANAWKKWQGELKGVVRLKAADRKRELENQFMAWAADKPKYKDVLPQLAAKYAELEDYAFARDYYNETYVPIEITDFAAKFAKYSDASKIDDAAKAELKAAADKFFKDYLQAIDSRIIVAMLDEYARNITPDFYPALFTDYKASRGSLTLKDFEANVAWMFDNTNFATPERVDALLAMSPEQMAATIAKDPVLLLQKSFTELYRTKISPQYARINDEIDLLYRAYMQGLMEMQPTRQFYPDANSTLRVAYGKVEGYKPADGVYYKPYSTIEGVMEKDLPEVYDYNVPQRLRDLHKSKDYGVWGADGTVPVDFLASNHTTGGNSGSPILNAKGELLGLNFDRTWESTMSDVMYDPEICRNISVDIRYVLFVVDKLAGAGYLLDEMRFAE